MNTQVIKFREYGNFLSTRFLGKRLRDLIQSKAVKNEVVIINMEGVEGMTNSFADECFAKLAEGMGLETFKERIKFKGLASLPKRIIIHAIMNRCYRGN